MFRNPWMIFANIVPEFSLKFENILNCMSNGGCMNQMSLLWAKPLTKIT